MNNKEVNKDKLDALVLEMCKIIGDAEMDDDGDNIDAISDMKCSEIETKIKMEFLKAGYEMDSYGDIIDNRAGKRCKTPNRLSHLSLIK